MVGSICLFVFSTWMGGSRIGKCYYLPTFVPKVCTQLQTHTQIAPCTPFLHRLLLEAGRALLSCSHRSVAASTMSLEESPMSARARSMALARALLERSHQGLDEISVPPTHLVISCAAR